MEGSVPKNHKKRKLENNVESEEEKESFKHKTNTPKKLRKDDKVSERAIEIDEEEEKGSNIKMHRIIVWLRNDLRVHDNPVLDWAVKYGGKNKEVLPVYSFDPRFINFKVPKYETLKCGPVRARFLHESVINMREKLEGLGSRLLVTTEKPEDFLPKLLRTDGDNSLVYQQEICKEEKDIEEAVKEAQKKKTPKVQIESIWGSTIYHIDDLPYKAATELPHIYGKFREKSEGTRIRALLPTPKKGELPFPGKPTKDIEAAT